LKTGKPGSRISDTSLGGMKKSMESLGRSPAAGKVIDPNEFSGIMSSPGLCGNNSILDR
jgi:hypothetical protein